MIEWSHASLYCLTLCIGTPAMATTPPPQIFSGTPPPSIIIFFVFQVLKEKKGEKMQLDVDVSPPANIMTFKPGLTYLTFDLDPCDL